MASPPSMRSWAERSRAQRHCRAAPVLVRVGVEKVLLRAGQEHEFRRDAGRRLTRRSVSPASVR